MDLLDKARQWISGKPKRTPAELALEEARGQVSKARGLHDSLAGRVNALAGDSARLARECAGQEAEKRKWTDLAQEAAAAGKPADAQTAAAKQAECQARLEALQRLKAEDDRVLGQLMSGLEASRARIEQADHSVTALAARADSADIRIQLDQALGADPTLGLSALSQQVDEKEAEASAWDEISTQRR